MKKLLFLLTLFSVSFWAKADEGMWFLALMQQQHVADSLRKAGCKLKAAEIYSEQKASLKNKVGIFGAGCTGEIVSPKGLVFTNNHCGFSYINAISTVQHNYLRDGFFAHRFSEELPTPDLDFAFVLHIQNVSDSVQQWAAQEGVDSYVRQSRRYLDKAAARFLQHSPYADTLRYKNIHATVESFFGGNEFYFIVYQVYTDVRLVANPPKNLAQFGGNSDNWEWPRQNVDFCAYRIYADRNGQPASYSPDNVPLSTPDFLPLSLKGYDEGDFAMIMGFPGRTQRFLTREQVQSLVQDHHAPVVKVGWKLLDFYRKEMAQSDSARLALQDTDMMLGNVVKNYDGMMKAVAKNHLLAAKSQEEAALFAYATKHGKSNYREAHEQIAKTCRQYADSLYDFQLLQYSLLPALYLSQFPLLEKWAHLLASHDTLAAQQLAQKIRQNMDEMKLDYQLRRYAVVQPIWQQSCRLAASKAVYAPDVTVLAQSLLLHPQRWQAFQAHPDMQLLQQDPLYRLCSTLQPLARDLYAAHTMREKLLSQPVQTYIEGLEEMYNNSKAPDANFTLRLTYGHVQPYSPRDGVHYDWQTTLKGMFEKEDASNEDYMTDPRTKTLFQQKAFGRYARKDGALPTCFLTNNDITGGNSGSPVLNKKGHLIGLAFDGNIESLSSDLMYNPRLQRCICVDVRYVLWTLDIYGGARYLFDELKIVE